MSVRGISHFYFETNSYPKTKNFWEALGFHLSMDLSSDGRGAGLFRKDGITFMIKEVEGAPQSQIFFGMQNPEETFRALKASKDVKVTKDLFSSHWNTQLIEIEDPDQRKFYLECGHD